MSDRRKREERLLKQWKEYGYIPDEPTDQREDSERIPTGRDRTTQRLRVLYILLGSGIVILAVALVLLFTQYY